jgi:hypothetical protein
MPRKSPPKPDEKPQFERFIEAAKTVGAADTDEGLPGLIRKVAPLPETEQTGSRRATSKRSKG